MSRFAPLLLLLLSAGCATTSNLPAGPRAAFEVRVVGHGPPMVLIPGLSSPGEVWNEVVAHYQDRYQCHVLSLAGFAGQRPIDGKLLPEVHDALVSYLSEQHLDRAVVVGHSLGGFLGLWLASSHPDLVGELVVIDAAPSLAALQAPSITPTEAAMQAGELRDQMRMATPDVRARYARTISKQLVSDSKQAARVADWSMRSDPDTVADAAHYVMTHDLRAELGTVRAPTLVIGTWLAYRPYVTREEMLVRFTDQYRGCTTCTVRLTDHARHFVMLDDPRGLLSQIDAFLQSPAATPIVRAP